MSHVHIAMYKLFANYCSKIYADSLFNCMVLYNLFLNRHFLRVNCYKHNILVCMSHIHFHYTK